jgi:murein DD-endopeptidase MepM/ murein hydrolase activator NlpD
MTSNAIRARWRSAPALLLTAIAICGLSSEALAAGSGGIGTGGSGGTTGTGTTDGVFPVRGHHTYGDGIGAGRNHQGQDILAECGKPIVAAQSGRIERVAYQSAAGNYVVIAGRRKAPDTVYMHLLHRSPVGEGERVAAGDQLGLVGQTGDATACHLHFEMWSPPGWYKGGSLLDPLPYLKRWDKTG